MTKLTFSMVRHDFEDRTFLEQGRIEVHFLHSSDGLPNLEGNAEEIEEQQEIILTDRDAMREVLDDFFN